MKLLLTAIMILIFTVVQAQDMGIGLRLGDPSGITFKKYFNEKNALEINLGRTRFGNGNGYYQSRYNDWYGNKNFNYTDFQYLGYSSNTPITIQVRYLFHKDFPDVPGLKWYYGAGGQIASQTYTFDYRYKIPGDNSWRLATGENVTDIDLGVDAILGLEYTFEDIPVSVFLDANLFVEIIDNPFLLWGQGGLGARYNF